MTTPATTGSTQTCDLATYGGWRFSRPTRSMWATAFTWDGLAFFAHRGSEFRSIWFGVASAMCICCLLGALYSRRTARRLQGEDRSVEWLDLLDDLGTSEALVVDGPSPDWRAEQSSRSRAEIAAATMCLLEDRLRGDATLQVPSLQLVRVGSAGVEFLLLHADEIAPRGFRSSDGGLVWTLDPDIDLDVVMTDRRELPLLTELGSDDDSTYFLPPGLDDDPVYDSPEEFQDSDGSSFGAPLMLVDTGTDLILEPFGIRLTRPDSHPTVDATAPTEEALPLDEVPQAEEPTADEVVESSPIDAVANSEEDLNGELEVLEAAEVEESSPAPLGDLVPRGAVEVRILRDRPDLVGELFAAATPAAVDFVAYLATHGHRVSTARLRDSIGTQKMQASRAGKTVWSAAGAARRAIGIARLPAAAGNQLYELSDEVSCDWTRFSALVEIARQPGIARAQARVALIQALALADGVPGAGSRRFIWLDKEGLLTEIAHGVAAAAAMLATLELDGGSLELAQLAIARGVVHFPGEPQLTRLQKVLGQRRHEQTKRVPATSGADRS